MKIKPGLKLDPSWFEYGESQRKFHKRAFDDLDKSF